MAAPRAARPHRPGEGGHVAASRLARPAAPPSRAFAPGPDSVRLMALDGLLVKLSLPVPADRVLAAGAIESLSGIRDEIAEALRDPRFPQELRGGFAVLVTRCELVLAYWPDVLAELADGPWGAAQAAALTGDLVEVVQVGAELRNLISPPAPGPEEVVASYPLNPPAPAVRHRRARDRGEDAGAGGYGTAAVLAVAQVRPDTRRAVVQAVGVVTAVGVVAAVCAMAFDRHQPPAPAPRAAVPARRSAVSIPAVGSRPAPSAAPSPRRSAEETPDPPGLVTSLQMVTLGASASVPQVAAVLYIDTTSTRAFAVNLRWFGTTGPGGGTTRTLAGSTHYVFSQPIDAAADCGGAVIVTATADGLTTSQSTTAGPCPASPTSSPTTTEAQQ